MTSPMKDITSEILELSEKQLEYLRNSRVASLEGLGVEPCELRDWQKNPLFRTVEALIDSFCSLDETNFEAHLPEISAGLLVHLGYTYAEIEAHLKLEHGTLLRWLNSKIAADRKFYTDTKNENYDGEIFKTALNCANYSDPIAQEERENFENEKRAISEKQSLAIPLILAGKTDKEVGDVIGVSRYTIISWRHDSSFAEELHTEREILRESQLQALSTTITKAFKVVEELLEDKNPQVRLKAALGILKGVNFQPQVIPKRLPSPDKKYFYENGGTDTEF